MTRASSLLPVLVLASIPMLTACPETELICDTGFTKIDGMCVRVDAGTTVDAAPPDANVHDDDGGELDAHTPDGGPCATPCSGDTPLCREDGLCVACLADSDCTDPLNAQCDTTPGSCVPCDDSTQCARFPSSPVCADSGTRAGECVGCSATEADCPSGICLLDSNSCAPIAGSANACSPCIADDECQAGMLCVSFMYDDPTTSATDPVPAGNHCAWRQDASGSGAPNGACSNVRPYVRSGTATSLDGVDATVCTLRVSTCEAHADFSDVDCMTLGPAGDALCGIEALHDGVCRRFGPTTNRCTVFCLSSDDCRMGVTCNTGATPGTCNFM